MTRHDEALALIGRLRYLQQVQDDALTARDQYRATTARDQIVGLTASAGEQVVREALLTALRPTTDVPVVLGVADQARLVSVDEIRLLVERHDAAVVAWCNGKSWQTHDDCVTTHAALMGAVGTLADAAYDTEVARLSGEGRLS